MKEHNKYHLTGPHLYSHIKLNRTTHTLTCHLPRYESDIIIPLLVKLFRVSFTAKFC